MNSNTDLLMQFIPKSPDRISLKSLSFKLGSIERNTKEFVKAARIEGALIASDNRGYYVPVTKEELTKYYCTFHKRAMTALKSVKAARKMLVAMGVNVTAIERRRHEDTKESA